MPKPAVSRELKALGVSEPSPKKDGLANDLQALSDTAGGEENISRVQPPLNELAETPTLLNLEPQPLLQERWLEPSRDLYEACVSGDMVSVQSIFREWRNHTHFPGPIESHLQYLLVVAANAQLSPC